MPSYRQFMDETDLINKMAAHHLEVSAVKPFKNRLLVMVNIDKSHYFGTKVRELGLLGRRKFNNWVTLERGRIPLIIRYAN